MAVRKQASGKWLCECYPHGRESKRVRKQFATKGEAVASAWSSRKTSPRFVMSGDKNVNAHPTVTPLLYFEY